MTMANPYNNNGLSLNLSQSGAPLTNGASPYAMNNMMAAAPAAQPAFNPYAAQQSQPSFGSAILSGFTGQDPYNPTPIMPPSDTEILMTMLDNAYPVERFLSTPLFNQLLEIVGAITMFSVLNLMKNASYTFDEDAGTFALDVASLPAELRTMSSENIGAQLAAMSA